MGIAIPGRATLRSALGALTLALAGCFPSQGAVSMKVARHPETPKDASVTIDEQYVGPLGFVAVRGVRLRVGEHRITVEREGFFPFDAIVVADRKPLHLDVELVPIPD